MSAKDAQADNVFCKLCCLQSDREEKASCKGLQGTSKCETKYWTESVAMFSYKCVNLY